jgi:hypothetical protein
VSVARALATTTLVLVVACSSSSGDGSPGATDAGGSSDGTVAGDGGEGTDASVPSDAPAASDSGADSGALADGGPDAEPVDSGFVCRADEKPCGGDTDCCSGLCQSVGRTCGCSMFVGSKCDRGPDCCPGMGCSLDTARCAYGGGHTCQQNTDCLSGYCPNGTCA